MIGSDNGLSPGRHRAIIWTNAGMLLIGPWGTNFSEILIEIQTFSFMKKRLKMSFAKSRPFCLGLNELSPGLTNHEVCNAGEHSDRNHSHWHYITDDLGHKLDESTARRQLKSPQSLPGRSIHLTLVTKWSWSWSWMTYCHLLCAMSISPPILRHNYFKISPWKSMVKVICVVKGQDHIWPSKFKGQGYGQVQTHWSHLRPGVQSMCLLFISRQSDHLWLRYSKFYIWLWKFKVKVMAKVKPDGHIWALEFNQYVCFSFHDNRTIFGWDIANSVFDLENSRSRSWPRSNPMVTFEP